MKKITLFITFITVAGLAFAQQGDPRTTKTKIADLLMNVPAPDSVRFQEVMTAISGLGEDGLAEMASQLIPHAEGSNAAWQYALNSYSGYVSKGNRESARQVAVKAYCQALDRVSAVENKAFLIRQLQMVGRDDAVDCLQSFLTDADLAGPAARALASIRTASANRALLSALNTANGSVALDLMEALGHSRYQGAAPAIVEKLKESQDQAYTKMALFALAEIGDPTSAEILQAKAAAQQYQYDLTDATAAYLRYIERLKENGHQSLARDLAGSLLKALRKSDAVHVRSAGLSLAGPLQPAALSKALKDDNDAYRAAALALSGPEISAAEAAAIIKRSKKSNPEAQAQLITFLGTHGVKTAFPMIKTVLKKSSDSVLRAAAIQALVQTGQAQALPALFDVMKKGDAEAIQRVKNALLTADGSGMEAQIASVLPQMRPKAQIALLEVLAARSATDQFDGVFTLLKAEDVAVKQAAYKALESVATPAQLPSLFALLNASVQDTETKSIQLAIAYALRDEADTAVKTQQVLDHLAKAPRGKVGLYYPILASIGGADALVTVTEAYREGNQAEAVAALAAWPDISALPALYAVMAQTQNKQQHGQALRAFVRLTCQSSVPDEQKVILLKDAMAAAETDAQKQSITKEASNIKTFSALAFVGAYLDHAALQQAAAGAIVEIALTDVSYFYGTVVEQLLSKTLQVLAGRDSEYLQEAIRKHLAEMPKEAGFVSVFNGKDLRGWKGLVANPIKRAQMSAEVLAAQQKKADAAMRASWVVQHGELLFTGNGDNIVTQKQYGDIEMYIDWKILDDGHREGDAGIYLRGTPQVQIWDTARVNVGAQVGSGALYNNQVHESKPLKVADNALGRWNNFHIRMKGDRVTVYLNGELVTDNVVLENYWDRKLPLFAKEQIELQAHGSRVAYRDIYIKELPRQEIR